MGQVTQAQDPLRAPEPLTDDHSLDAFASGAPTLDAWLMRKARANQASGASRTYVLCRGRRVVGYYALTAGSIELVNAPSRIARSMPRFPVPVVILTRLGVDQRVQGRGLGRALLTDALLRVASASEVLGARALLIHCENDDAKTFHLHLGEFEESPTDSLHLYLLMSDLRKTISGAG